MKTKIFILLFWGGICLQIILPQELPAQSLIDLYRNGTVTLVPDTAYARNNDWEQVFALYYDTLYNRPMGNRKQIVMMPDRSIVVSHEYRNLYSLFDSLGNFVKEFSIVGNSGKPMKETKKIKGTIQQHFFTEPDNMGRMICCDFNGRYVKTLTLNYMTRSIIPLANNKLGVVGWVIWKDRYRDFVALVDYQTNEEHIIWSQFTNDINKSMYGEIKAAFVNDQIIITIPREGEILIYGMNGNLISKNKVEWEIPYLSVEEQKAARRKALASWKADESIRASDEILKQVEESIEKITEPLKLPAFSNVLKDSDDNLLIFEIPKEEGSNLFHVWTYRDGGKFITQGRFVCDDYDLSITPEKMIFHEGYLYALQILKNVQGNPLRLVRFKLSN